jgi:hypothetical protein
MGTKIHEIQDLTAKSWLEIMERFATKAVAHILFFVFATVLLAVFLVWVLVKQLFKCAIIHPPARNEMAFTRGWCYHICVLKPANQGEEKIL